MNDYQYFYSCILYMYVFCFCFVLFCIYLFILGFFFLINILWWDDGDNSQLFCKYMNTTLLKVCIWGLKKIRLLAVNLFWFYFLYNIFIYLHYYYYEYFRAALVLEESSYIFCCCLFTKQLFLHFRNNSITRFARNSAFAVLIYFNYALAIHFSFII